MKKWLSIAALLSILNASPVPFIASFDLDGNEIEIHGNTKIIRKPVHPGWQLLGAPKDFNMTEFNKSEIITVWAYDDKTQKWLAYSPNPYLMDLIKKTPNVDVLNRISKYSGFWVFANGFTSIKMEELQMNTSSHSNFNVDEILNLLTVCVKPENSTDPDAVVYFAPDKEGSVYPDVIETVNLSIDGKVVGTLTLSHPKDGFFLYVAGNGDVYKGYFNDGKLVKIGKTNKFIDKCDMSSEGTYPPPPTKGGSSSSSTSSMCENVNPITEDCEDCLTLPYEGCGTDLFENPIPCSSSSSPSYSAVCDEDINPMSNCEYEEASSTSSVSSEEESSSLEQSFLLE